MKSFLDEMFRKGPRIVRPDRTAQAEEKRAHADLNEQADDDRNVIVCLLPKIIEHQRCAENVAAYRQIQ